MGLPTTNAPLTIPRYVNVSPRLVTVSPPVQLIHAWDNREENGLCGIQTHLCFLTYYVRHGNNVVPGLRDTFVSVTVIKGLRKTRRPKRYLCVDEFRGKSKTAVTVSLLFYQNALCWGNNLW